MGNNATKQKARDFRKQDLLDNAIKDNLDWCFCEEK